MRVLATVGILLALSAVPALAGDFEDGLKFYQGKDYASAITSWKKAAALRSAPAQFTLGFMYEKGEGVTADNSQAMSWYQKAADQGYAAAQINLGSMYEKGQGIAPDLRQAVSW